MEDGDIIYVVVKVVLVNNDGRMVGLVIFNLEV